MKRILYVEGCRDGTVGGSHSCLFNMVAYIDRKKYYPIVIFYDDHIIARKLRELEVETHIFKKYIPFDVRKLLKSVSPRLVCLTPVFLPIQKAINLFFYSLRFALIYTQYLKKQNIDIVHLNNSLNTNHEWMLAGKLAGIRVVSHERGISEKLSRASKYLGKRLDFLICVSRAIQTPLLRQGMSNEKTVVVYDGIDFSKIVSRSTTEEIKAAWSITGNYPVIGVVGNIKHWKGQETVVRATAILKKTWPWINCLLVGSTIEGDPYKENLEKIVKTLEITENVIFTGFQNHPADFMNAMDVVIHSSIEPEPFGMVNLEAMYLKKPVIATKMGGPTEIFTDGEDGILVEPGDPELLAQKILELLANPELRREMGEKAHKTVINKFSISHTINHIEKIYEELCRQ